MKIVSLKDNYNSVSLGRVTCIQQAPEQQCRKHKTFTTDK
jgi:hypothetical protein